MASCRWQTLPTIRRHPKPSCPDDRLIVGACDDSFEACSNSDAHRSQNENYAKMIGQLLRPCDDDSLGSIRPSPQIWTEGGYVNCEDDYPFLDYEDGYEDDSGEDCDMEMVFGQEDDNDDANVEDEMSRFMRESRERMEESTARTRESEKTIERMKTEATERAVVQAKEQEKFNELSKKLLEAMADLKEMAPARADDPPARIKEVSPPVAVPCDLHGFASCGGCRGFDGGGAQDDCCGTFGAHAPGVEWCICCDW